MFTIFLSKIYFSSLLNSWENKLLEFSCFLENMTCLEKSKVHVYKILKTCHSVLKGISPILKYWPHPFLPTPPPPKKKQLENLTPPPHTLKYILVQKSKDSCFKETKDFISNNGHISTLKSEKYEYTVAKSKKQRRSIDRLTRHF